MKVSRRSFIRTLGGTGVVLGASAVGVIQCDRMPSTAVEGWQGPGSGIKDPREWALAHALLAPNPHNIQSWIADLRQPGHVTLLVDPGRLLPETDPHGRQITIGQGTFLELFDIASRELGFRADIALFPDGFAPSDAPVSTIPNFPIAKITMTKDPTIEKSGLFRSVFARRSCKEPYSMETVLSAEHAQALSSAHTDPDIALSIVREGQVPAALRTLTRDAMVTEMQTPRTLKESIDLTRIGGGEIEQHRDGIDLHGPMFWWLKTLGLMTPENAMTPGTLAHQGGIDYALGWSEATPSFGWIATKGNNRIDQINAGRAYVRLNLQATANGIAMHPVSQLLQEYPEMESLQREFYSVTKTPEEETVQMLFRLGYAEAPPPSPRRPLDALLRT